MTKHKYVLFCPTINKIIMMGRHHTEVWVKTSTSLTCDVGDLDITDINAGDDPDLGDDLDFTERN